MQGNSSLVRRLFPVVSPVDRDLVAAVREVSRSGPSSVEALRLLLGALQVLPVRTYAGDASPAHTYVSRSLSSRRTRRALERIGGVSPGLEVYGVFRPLAASRLGRHFPRALPEGAFDGVEAEVAALLALWAPTSGPVRSDGFVLLRTRYVPSSPAVARVLRWFALPAAWDEHDREVFSALLADGVLPHDAASMTELL